MCQEYHCDCCSNELPEDACECIECYHGDQDSDVNHVATKSLSPAKCRVIVNPADLYASQRFCDDGKDLCNGEEQTISSSPASCTKEPCNKKICRESKCCSAIDQVGRESVLPSACTSRQQRSQPLQPDEGSCCDVPTQDANAMDSSPCLDCCSGNEASQSDTIDSADLSRRTTPDCCEKESLDDCCTACHTTCSCAGIDDDSGRPPSSTDASSVSTCCDAVSSCQSSCCQAKAPVVTCQSRNLASSSLQVKCSESKPCNGSTCESRTLPTIVTSSSAKDKCCKSKPCNGGTCQSRTLSTTDACSSAEDKCYENKPCNGGTCTLRIFPAIVTCLSPQDKCCQSKPCNGGTCESREEDKSCKEELSVEDCRYRSVSRVSMTDCSGFYPITPPATPGAKESDGSDKKPLVRQSTTKLRVQNICCAMESKLVQESLEPLEGVVSIAVNVIGRVVYVRHNPEVTSPTELVNTLNRVHLGASIMETGSHQSDSKNESLPPKLSSFLIYLLIQTILLMVAVVAFFAKVSWYQWVSIAEIVFGIAPVFKKSYVSFKTCTVDINILLLIAITGTLAIQEWLEGAAVVYVFSLAEALQEFCMHKVQRTISGLLLKAPQVAILASTGECVPVEAVAIGTAIAIRPGELIPLDGVVVKGRAAVDESSVSGESVPVEKTAGSKVCSGTVNQNGYLEVETTSDSTSSTVSKVAQLVQEAQTGSARTEIAINRFAKYYTPAVVIVAALVVVIPAILGAAGMGTYSQEIREWGRRALVLLVIACPCALVMSTPIAVVCGITAAARKGALIKGGAHLETLARLEVLAFDKTGTLTEGKFQVVDIECSFGVQERGALRLAAALESKSSHPLAAAIVNEFSGCVAERVKSQSASLPEVSRFNLHEGQGISGVVDGHLVQIGNYEFLHHVAGKTLSKYMEAKYITWCNESNTVIFVCVDGKLAMMIALADTIRPNSLATLDWLRKLRVQSAMITGDNTRTAVAVKSKLGLNECIAEMKPQNKLSWIENRQAGVVDGKKFASEQPARRFQASCCSCRRYNIARPRDNSNKSIVGMVGDGVNDGPALAAANVGIAMGAGGTALAVDAADVALMSNNLAKIPQLVELGRFCRRVVAENITFSVVLKLAIVIAALAGKAAVWMAVLADVLGLLFVILNGLRPLWWKIAQKDDAKNTDFELAFVKNARQVYSYESYV